MLWASPAAAGVLDNGVATSALLTLESLPNDVLMQMMRQIISSRAAAVPDQYVPRPPHTMLPRDTHR